MIASLYLRREALRNKIRSYWKEGISFGDKERLTVQQLNEVHQDIVRHELINTEKSWERIVYSVCGWSQRHSYFRNKSEQTELLNEAIQVLEILKKDPEWRIPTVIVKETYYRRNSPAMVDFDGNINNLGFSDTQEVVLKHMCGSRSHRWNNLGLNHERVTY